MELVWPEIMRLQRELAALGNQVEGVSRAAGQAIHILEARITELEGGNRKPAGSNVLPFRKLTPAPPPLIVTGPDEDDGA